MNWKPQRRWFRFSLSTLLVVVTVFCCWLGYQLNWIRQRRAAEEWIRKHGLFEESRQFLEIVPGRNDFMSPYVDAPWSLRLFGEKGVATVFMLAPKIRDPRIAETKGQEFLSLFPEAEIALIGPKVEKWFRRLERSGATE